MPEITYQEVIQAFEGGHYIKAVQQAHDFCQMALYEVMIAAFDLLGDSKQVEFFLRKNMSLSGNSTLKKQEIELATSLGVITKEEKEFLCKLKAMRDRGPAHNSMFYEKEVGADDIRKKDVRDHILEAEKFINVLLKKRSVLSAKRLQESMNIMNEKHKVGDLVPHRVWVREQLPLILQEAGI